MNNVRLFGYFLPIVYLYPLLILPYQTPRWLSVLFGGLIGFLLDMAMNSPGLNMGASTLIGFLRTPLLYNLSETEELEGISGPIRPSTYTIKPKNFFLYFAILVFIHIAVLMLVEAFSVNLFARIIPNILGSTVISLLIIFVLEALTPRKIRS